MFLEPELFASPAVGVGHHPKAVTLVRSSDVACSEHHPLRIVPERGKVFEDDAEPPVDEERAVLDEDVARHDFADDSGHLTPEAASLAVDACAAASGRDVLTGKSSRYDVNTASPWSAVKGANVIPYRERRERAFILSGDEYPCGIGVELDGAHGTPPKKDAGKYASTSARE